MSYFTPEYLKFFRGLAKNNSKTWFEANRERYENEVKKPFAAFVEQMIARIHAEDAEVRISAKEAIFRINRDIRFSKDKTPYKTHMAALISPAGRADHETPGFYLQFGADMVMLAGGVYTPANESVYRIRRAIVNHPKEFQALLQDKEFKKKYVTLQGEANKVLPGEFKEAALQQPLLANKQFYYATELEAETILKKNLPDFLMQYCRAGRGMNAFLKRALGK